MTRQRPLLLLTIATVGAIALAFSPVAARQGWIDTIKRLDLGTVLPGHGAAFTDLAKLDHWQAYMRDFWAQAQKFHKAGTPWEEAAKLVDLRGNAVNYPMIRTAGLTPNHGMRRAYEFLDGRVR